MQSRALISRILSQLWSERMITKTELAPPLPPRCERCGGVLQLLYTLFNSKSGMQSRQFKCGCGERTVEQLGPRQGIKN